MHTGILVLQDGQVFYGQGFGFVGGQAGEICFNTGLSGYQETITDPSYAGQIITFTMPHIGNVGVNHEDLEASKPAARGIIVRNPPTPPSNWRSEQHFDNWLKDKHVVGLSGLDTRALTIHIRDRGAPVGVIAHDPSGAFDIKALQQKALAFGSLNGMDLAKTVAPQKSDTGTENSGTWATLNANAQCLMPNAPLIVAIDYGMKDNIKRCLVDVGFEVVMVPATASLEEILAYQPKGIFLSNGPGDPAATGEYAIPLIKGLLERDLPLFGICLGFQLLALALGARSGKLPLGHRGANHPVLETHTGKVTITSQNHGFHILPDSLPNDVRVTHISLFDKTLEGIESTRYKAFAVQYHPEASPGPHDARGLFEKFRGMVGG
jgi:carbamoyl-phosphate synthase small subunit